MFAQIKKMWTDNNKSILAPNQISVTYSCGHEGKRRSHYFDMLSPSALENYLEALKLEPRDGEQPNLLDKLEALQRELE